MVNGGAQARLYAPRSSIRNGTAQVECWNLPAYICVTASRSIEMGLGGDDVKPAIVHTRVAEALGIEDGDTIEFDLRGYSERLSLPVTVKNVQADFMVHPLMGNVPSFESCQMTMRGDLVKFKNGDQVDFFNQHVWAGLSIVTPYGTAILTFDGASRNNPDGPAGCGFAIYSSENGRTCGGNLVMGSRYFGKGSSNEMEYQGLLEGLYWAVKLKLNSLVVQGDSELVIKQMKGEYNVNAPNLRPLYRKAQEMLERSGLEVTFRHTSRDNNSVSDSLANRAIDLQENSTCCNWPNVNRQCRRTPY